MAEDETTGEAKKPGKPAPRKPSLPGTKTDGAATTNSGAKPAAPPPAVKTVAKGKGKLPPGFG